MLEAKGVCKSYKNGTRLLYVLNGIDLKIGKSEFVSILGPSGAGKSTLLHILGGIDMPTAGSVKLDGEDIYKLTDKKKAQIRNKKVGFVFQFYHLLGEFSALENIMIPAMMKKEERGRKNIITRAKEILRSVGLGGRIDHRPGQLSGGEQQRVAIARAIINEPQVLLCDEPTGNLDSVSGKEIIELLVKLNKDKKTTVVVVTHEEQIAKRADRIFYMKDGKLN